MHLNILTPDGSIFSGDAYGAQLPGVSGSFEVLNNHAPMIAALGEGRLKVLQGSLTGSAIFYDVHGGFVEVLNNNVTVLVEGAKKV